MDITLQRCLEDLERRLDLRQEAAGRQAWDDFLHGRCREPVFCPPARVPSPPAIEWPAVHINDAQDDVDLMLLSQFRLVSDVLAAGGRARLNVRCNHGTGILPSLFGAETFTMPRETDTLPTTRPLGSLAAVRRAVDSGPPPIDAAMGAMVFACAERFLEAFTHFPAVAEAVELYHPDLQGPIDAAEMVWGSDIFLAFYDDLDLLTDLLDVITQTYERFMRAWFDRVGPPRDVNAHWGLAHRGAIMLREDSLMNLSPQVYAEIIRPFDQRLLDAFGGGAVHYCGRGEHFIAELTALDGLTGVNLSQPHLNDMEAIYRATIDRGIPLIGLDAAEARRAHAAGRALRGLVHSYDPIA